MADTAPKIATDTASKLGYKLSDRYTATHGRVYLTGTQALVRLVLDQARRDRVAGLNTGGFVSGYRGSPLGGVDQAMWAAAGLTAEHGIEFLPAVNEDLAATAVLGSQQVETTPGAAVDGVFGLWYGKGPGVDRAGDALKHGNAYGSSPHGGVLVVAGDDHGCVSSSMPHQSDVAFMSWLMPVLNPASVAEYLAFGEYGYALSRFSGMWVGFKAISETVEAAASVGLPAPRIFQKPDFTPPPGGLHYRWPDLPGPGIEERMEAKKHAVFAFADANPIDRVEFGVADAVYGIVTTGKGYLDVMEALRLLGLSADDCHRLGIEVYKVGMVWPLARRAALDFVRGKHEVLVIEEKRGIIESQLKEYFYDWPGDKPERMVGKNDETLHRLIPWTGELSPRQLAPLIARRLHHLFPHENFEARAAALTAKTPALVDVPGVVRTPYFCSGCPHNTSTRVPEGSRALAGIGCHFMASWMDRETSSLIQMGGEGVNWAASSRFTGRGHIFQNLGEGTWYHSGSMAIRQSVAAGANITYKILYNDAVAMTGGQPVDGPVSVAAIAQTCRAEGVAHIVLVTEDTDRIPATDLPHGTTIHHRSELDQVQRDLRQVPGVSVLIYDQACATETRRRRKRGLAPDPMTFPQINEMVCEGCGDCSVASNCLSVEPVETEFGRKRRINLSSCNQDHSCLDGFCPSFVTVENARRRPARRQALLDPADLLKDVVAPTPSIPDPVFNLLVTGVGGTGVVTLGQVITMAAHLQGLGASVLDFTGFAQKFGPVLSFIRLGQQPDDINQVRIDQASADAVIAGDVVVSSSSRASRTYRAGTRMVVNLAAQPTGDVVQNRDADLAVDHRLASLQGELGNENVQAVDAHQLAERLMGDSVFANIILLGHAWQSGLVPVELDALRRAMELNNVRVAENLRAFDWGRVLAANPDVLDEIDARRTQKPADAERAAGLIARRVEFLTDYQDAKWAERYRSRVVGFQVAISEHLPAPIVEELTTLAARSLFKLMSYKDEYEVARLHADPAFTRQLSDRFQPGYRLRYHLAPPFLQGATDARGRLVKRSFGPWMRHVFQVLQHGRRLRGTAFDLFGRTEERRLEKALIPWFEGVLADVSRGLKASSKDKQAELEMARQRLRAPMDIRGYGPVKLAAIRKLPDFPG